MLATTSGETLNIISHPECEIVIEDFFKELRQDISTLKICPLVDDNKIISKSISHSLFKGKEYDRNIKGIKDIVFNASIDCEKFIGGSSDTFLLILEKILGLHKDKRIEYTEMCLGQSIKLQNQKRRVGKYDINKIIKNYHPLSKDLIKSTIEMATPKTFIKLEKSAFLKDRIIKRENICFNISPVPGFVSGDWIRDDVNILMIDGIVDNVSQIHHLLSKAFESKEPYLLIARAYNPEVIQTIAENYSRGLIDMIPVDLGFSMDNHHFMKDISTIFEIDYASPDLGDVISVFVRRGIPKINKIKLTKNTIEFYVTENENLENLRNSVIEMLGENLGFEADELINKRLSSLASDVLTISVGKDTCMSNPIVIEEIDSFIRRFISLIRDGIIFTKDINIDKVKKVYSSIELAFIYNKILSVLKSINKVKCIIKGG